MRETQVRRRPRVLPEPARPWLGARPSPELESPVKPLLGISLKVLSALAFTIMSAGIKQVSADYPTGEIVFFRSAFAIVPLLTWLGWQGDLINAIRTSNVRGHLLRGIISSCGMFAGFVALAYLPLSDAIAIGYASPLIVVVLAALVLKETVWAYRWTAVAVGFAGVLIMLMPHLSGGAFSQGFGGGPLVGVLFALLGAVCSAGATIQVRRLLATERTGAIVLYFSLITTALGFVTIVLGWRMPGAADFALLVFIGVLGGIGQILLTQSFRYADASLVAPFEYTTMLWAFLIGWFVFGQAPQAAVVSGAAIVTAAGLFVLWREDKLGLARAKDAENATQRPA
jgi:drug/metabolite transporter (DMT)-like permease